MANCSSSASMSRDHCCQVPGPTPPPALADLAHKRRRVIHFNVAAHPTSEWTDQQLREAFPFDQIPPSLLRDRDRIFGDDFRRQVADIKIQDVLSASRSPWHRAYVERVIGSIRRLIAASVQSLKTEFAKASLADIKTTTKRGAVHVGTPIARLSDLQFSYSWDSCLRKTSKKKVVVQFKGFTVEQQTYNRIFYVTFRLPRAQLHTAAVKKASRVRVYTNVFWGA